MGLSARFPCGSAPPPLFAPLGPIGRRAGIQAEGLDVSSRGWNDESARSDTPGQPPKPSDPEGVIVARASGYEQSIKTCGRST